ncbi:MAG: hypothetical protein A3I78_01635 [Gammaproteobacteria bacterium RIFCSPLOWO2_02_FULL_56_15]|nr:MAG: hypothetical protein A3I78_01635 [Gammaproteobacteria bacterium RIFCSPLOWO2_02_FULL_56_15]
MFRSTVSTLTTTTLAGLMLALGACNKAADTASQEAAVLAPAPAAVAAACDRQCLINATDAYVAAIVAHNPSMAPLAANVVFVENVTKMQPGEGLWKTAVKAPSTFAIHVPDEINHTVGYLAMMTYMAPPPAPQGTSPEERAAFAASNPPIEQPVVVAFRLQFDDSGKILEAEHLLSGIREAQMVNLQAPRPGILTDIPPEYRKPHDELIAIGASYYDALDDNNGELMPFAPDCERHENGMITASGNPAPAAPAIPGANPAPNVARDCRGQLNSGSFQYIARIENRRVFAADPQTGLVIGLSHFRHPMDNLPYTVTNLDGSTSERTKDNMPFAPFDLPAGHIYKIGADGLVHEIEAMGFTTTYNAPTGWE